MFSGTAQVSLQVSHFFFFSSVCLLVRVTMVDKKKAIVCCLLTTSAIMLAEKRTESVKCWVRSGIWKGMYHTMLVCWMNFEKVECLEMMPSWCRQENEETVGFSEWTAQFSVWKTTARTVLRSALLPVKTAQFTQFFRQVWRHTVKSFSLTENV